MHGCWMQICCWPYVRLLLGNQSRFQMRLILILYFVRGHGTWWNKRPKPCLSSWPFVVHSVCLRSLINFQGPTQQVAMHVRCQQLARSTTQERRPTVLNPAPGEKNPLRQRQGRRQEQEQRKVTQVGQTVFCAQCVPFPSENSPAAKFAVLCVHFVSFWPTLRRN